MYRQQRQPFHSRGRSTTNGRHIKTVSKHALLAAIEKSRSSSAVQAGEEPYMPVHKTMTEFDLNPVLKENIRNKGYVTPTPIQDQAIDAILKGRDIIGTANTGTGKTAAFLIPLLHKLSQDRNQRILVIIPTRELAVQIRDELRELGRGLSVRDALLIGGAGERRQRRDLTANPHVVIATPGRLKDFIRAHHIRLSTFRNVVLDEADRMVDIGFINDIKYFISLLPQERQSLCFSATISDSVREMLIDFVHNPVQISVKKRDITHTIRQEVIRAGDTNSKVELLHDLLNKREFEKVLVFGRTKWGVQRLSDQLNKRGFKTAAIHGNKRQSQRQRVLEEFVHNKIQVLLATDVASRGLDIPDVTHVINYELPGTIEDYIHRIGRTGRADKQGTAITFVE